MIQIVFVLSNSGFKWHTDRCWELEDEVIIRVLCGWAEWLHQFQICRILPAFNTTFFFFLYKLFDSGSPCYGPHCFGLCWSYSQCHCWYLTPWREKLCILPFKSYVRILSGKISLLPLWKINLDISLRNKSYLVGRYAGCMRHWLNAEEFWFPSFTSIVYSVFLRFEDM